ncbi:MAG TPA: preprotein translocase subunit SecG [Candidatus Angelobacter sp.]|nr:preprotein translocase subunit SecG [Candidatus Angelobacter sp.]
MWLTYLITVVHVMVCAVLILVVLLQHGKSADIAATFGGSASQTAFGPRGTATLLSRVTTWCAVIFMLTSISLTIFASKRHSNSVMENVKGAPTAPAQSTPAAPSPKR